MEKTLEQIAELIRIELLKRGFIVSVMCIPTKDNSFKVKTSSFQTTPALFKNVWIEVIGNIYDNSNLLED